MVDSSKILLKTLFYYFKELESKGKDSEESLENIALITGDLSSKIKQEFYSHKMSKKKLYVDESLINDLNVLCSNGYIREIRVDRNNYELRSKNIIQNKVYTINISGICSANEAEIPDTIEKSIRKLVVKYAKIKPRNNILMAF